MAGMDQKEIARRSNTSTIVIRVHITIMTA